MPIQSLFTRRTAVRLIVGAGAAFAVAACSMTPPQDLNLARARVTDGGRYQTSIAPNVETLKVGEVHGWTVELRGLDGAPINDARFALDGGMPQHGHSYPTKPRVTQNLGGGKYLVEGMKFSMPGWWTLVVKVDGPAGADALTYNIVL